MAIQGFRDKITEAVFKGEIPKKLGADLVKAARRKLNAVDAAETLDDLRSPPGNRLHPLVEDRAGQHAIRINGQWRICFRWTDQGPTDVEIADYH